MDKKSLKKTYTPRKGGSRVVQPKAPANTPAKGTDKKGGPDNAG